eukprot:SAG11_NODE_428_length_9551_cov_6.526978_2_plen_336_part_00
MYGLLSLDLEASGRDNTSMACFSTLYDDGYIHKPDDDGFVHKIVNPWEVPCEVYHDDEVDQCIAKLQCDAMDQRWVDDPTFIEAGLGALAYDGDATCSEGESVTVRVPNTVLKDISWHYYAATIVRMHGATVTLELQNHTYATFNASDVITLSGQRCRSSHSVADSASALPAGTVPYACVAYGANTVGTDAKAGTGVSVAYQLWMGAVALLSLADRTCFMRMLSTDYITLLFDEMYSVVGAAAYSRFEDVALLRIRRTARRFALLVVLPTFCYVFGFRACSLPALKSSSFAQTLATQLADRCMSVRASSYLITYWYGSLARRFPSRLRYCSHEVQ